MASRVKDVEQQVIAAINHNDVLRNKLGQKLIHLKLKGREDIARDYKRLISLKSAGIYYAVKAAQMRPLVEEKALLPSKEVQKRIEDIERDIFNTLSGGVVEDVQEEFSDFEINDCISALSNNYNKLQTALIEYEAVKEELENPDEFTDEGFRKYEVEKRKLLQDTAEALKIEMTLIERKVEEVETLGKEDSDKFEQERLKVQAKISDVKTKRDKVKKLSQEWEENRRNVSDLRHKRNIQLCYLQNQMKTILTQIEGLAASDVDKELEMYNKGVIETKNSLETLKSDLEPTLTQKNETLEQLKKDIERLQVEELSLINTERIKKEHYDKINSENQQLTTNITGKRNHDMMILRNLQNCTTDIASDMDLDCTKWRNNYMSNIFEAGVIDINLFKNISFANKEKYKKPDERYQVNKAIDPEIKMIDIGINDLNTRSECIKDEITILNRKKASISIQRDKKEKQSQAIVKKQDTIETKSCRLQTLLQDHNDTSRHLLDELVTLLPKTELLQDMSARALVAPILQRLNNSSLPEENVIVTTYNEIRAQLLNDNFENHSPEFIYQFLQEDWKHQLQLENMLEVRIKRIELGNIKTDLHDSL